MPLMYGNIAATPNTSVADGQNSVFLQGKAGELIASELRGKYYTANYRNKLFNAQVTIQTVPLITTAMVSVFTLYNPAGSGVVMEMVDTILANSNATTVVDVFGWYAGTAAQTAAGTFTTKGTVNSSVIGTLIVGQGQFYSAYTHSGLPTRQDVIGSFGAVTNANSTPPVKLYDGRLILPPGIAMSIGASLAAGPATGLDIQATWAEWPI